MCETTQVAERRIKGMMRCIWRYVRDGEGMVTRGDEGKRVTEMG